MNAKDRAQVLVNAVCQSDGNARGWVEDVAKDYELVLHLTVAGVSISSHSWKLDYFAEMTDEMVKEDVRDLIQQFRDL